MAEALMVVWAALVIEPISLRLSSGRLPKEMLVTFIRKFQEPVVDLQNSFRLDTAMHLFIIENCGNRYIIDMMHRVFEENTRIVISSKQNQTQIHDAKQEHLDILDLLYHDQYEAAEVRMRTHIESCRKAAMDYFYNMQMPASQQSSFYQRELAKL